MAEVMHKIEKSILIFLVVLVVGFCIRGFLLKSGAPQSIPWSEQ